MFLTTQNQTKRQSKMPFLFFFIYILLVFLIEPLYREYLFRQSEKIIIDIQSNDKENREVLYPLFIFFSDLGNFMPYTLIILGVYTFCNIYKTLTLLSSLFLSCLCVGFLKMIYLEPRPFFDNPKINPVDLETGWGNPSGHTTICVAFYLTLWGILFQNSNMKKRIWEKYITLSLFLIIIGLIISARLITASHTINQLIFGAQLGFGIYYLLFHILKINTNDANQLLSFIEIKNIIYAIINLIILFFGIFIFLLNWDKETQDRYKQNIETKFKDNQLICPPMERMMQNDGLITMIIFFANFSVFIAIKFELHITFQGNTFNWKCYNFNTESKNDNESLMTPINNITQWNHTNSLLVMLRLIFTVMVLFLVNYPFYFIKWENNYPIALIFKILFPIGNTCFCMFFVLKIFLKCLRLTNNTLYFRMIENTDNPFI